MKKTILLLMLLSLPLAHRAQEGAQPRVVAHRGGAGLGLENTLSCIEKGIATGVDAVEIDVRMTKDGQVVVCHDATVNATTDGRGRISDMTLQQVQSLKITGRDGVATTETIPTLAQVLTLVGGRCRLLVEVKRNRRSVSGIEEKIIEEVLAHDAAGWVAVQSFSDAVLERFKELNAPFPLEKLIVFKVPFLPLIFDGSLRQISLEKYSHISSFNFRKGFFPSVFARKMRKAGKEIKVWTLREPTDSYSSKVDAVITDYPDLWKK